jgi:YbbR domain-containing protein
MYDKDNNVVSSDILVGTLPSSTVRLPIYPMKSVPIDVLGSLVGTDDLAKNHEIVNAVATPATVRIVGEQSVLDAIDSILLTPIAVNGLNTTSTVESDLILPDGVRLLDSEKVSVLIEIQEMQMSQLFEQLEVQIVGTEKRANVTLDVSTVDLTVEGRYSLVSVLMRKDITVQVDVTGLAPGVYKLPLNVLVRDEAATVELTTTLSVTEVTVTITQQ